MPDYLILHIVFWVSACSLVWSYVGYPILMYFLSQKQTKNNKVYNTVDALPRVSILMSVYNEEKYLEEKVITLVTQDYKGAIEIYIGSDASSDRTNKILADLSSRYSNLHYFPYQKRRGKPSVINDLDLYIKEKHGQSRDHIYLLTDANVMLDTNVVTELIQHFKNKDIGLVDAHMTYSGMKEDGISNSENTYLNGEVRLKHYESIVTQKMIGPFGGCYALRSDIFKTIPSHFLVDDFYLAMQVFSTGKLAINELNAICREPVTHHLSQEYKRKKRIAAGNFQNFFHFKDLFNPITSLGLSLISHKLIRWLGPFLIALIIMISLFLGYKSIVIYKVISACLFIWFILIPLMDFLFSNLGIHFKFFRTISYFNLMNVALLAGFIKYIRGIKKGTWERTARV